MIPQVGQYVKIVFRNATQAEGVVESWSDEATILRSPDKKSIFIIQRTAEDVMAVKIILDYTGFTSLEKKIEETKEKFQQVYEQPSADDLRIKSMAQLKTAMIEQERKILAERMKEHRPTGIKNSYQYPDFFQKEPK
jgi:hypothetical protein